MRKIYYNHCPCPYGFKVGSIERYKNHVQKDETINVGSTACSYCKFYTNSTGDYILCSHSTFNDKLKIVKDLIK